MFNELDWTTFPVVLNRVLPLEVGIRRDFERLLPHQQHLRLYELLDTYTNSREYLLACAADGSLRYNMMGVPADEVRAEDRHRAAMLLLAAAMRDLANSDRLKI